jgi:hypothetical protein
MRLAVIGLFLAGASVASAANLADTQKLLARIKAVSKEGAGNQEAGAAWKELVVQGGDALLPTIAAMDDASPVAANWLRSAVNALAEKEKDAGRNLPAEQLEAFAKDSKHAPAARRLAYELLTTADPKAPDRLLPGFLGDPSGELRRDAVAAAMRKAERLEGEKAKAEFTRLFAAVRDPDQAEEIAKTLGTLGARPDLIAHYGVVTKWLVAGPFDHEMGTTFDKAYDPERKVDPAATYSGKGGAEVRWKHHVVEPDPKKTKMDELGVVDLNAVLGKHKNATAYAYSMIESDKERPVEVRLGCIVAVKVFVNGKEVFAREEYHHGSGFDQYRVSVTLKAGKNELLVKACQNDQKEPFAQVWNFMARVCDATGGATSVKVVTPEK